MRSALFHLAGRTAEVLPNLPSYFSAVKQDDPFAISAPFVPTGASKPREAGGDSEAASLPQPCAAPSPGTCALPGHLSRAGHGARPPQTRAGGVPAEILGGGA